MATPFLQAVCLPPRQKGAQTMRRVRRVSPSRAFDKSRLRQQHRLGDFESHAEALQPCREGPAQIMQPSSETPDAVSTLTLLLPATSSRRWPVSISTCCDALYRAIMRAARRVAMRARFAR
jgi:hypothetical protein